MLPLVSIITPSYNQGRFIEETILSVLDQDYSNIEYIIVDGGSTDNTFEVVDKYKTKLTFISEPDEGQSDAINKGFRMAKGEIIAWLNSDDTYEPGAIKTAVDYFLKAPEVGLVYGEGDIIDENGKKVKRFEATQEFDLWTLIHVWDYIMQPATFFKKEVLEAVGFLNKDLHWCMDWDLWIRIASEYEVGYINKVLANSREYKDTKTSTGGIKRLRELVDLMRKYGAYEYPPGFFIYGGSTLISLTENIPLLNLLVKLIVYNIHASVFRRLPCRYSDGWVGNRLSLSMPCHVNEVIIEGELLFNDSLPLTIKIKNKKKTFTKFKLKQIGNFSFNIKLPNDLNSIIKHMDIYINNTVVPHKLDKRNGDKRKLSLLVKNTWGL